MTLERYNKIVAETENDGWVSISRANKIYHEEFPDEEFTLFRRENNRIRIGFVTFIAPSLYLPSYFEEVPARREGISYQTEGSFDSIKEEHRVFLEANGIVA